MVVSIVFLCIYFYQKKIFFSQNLFLLNLPFLSTEPVIEAFGMGGRPKPYL